MPRKKKDPAIEKRLDYEIVVDCYDEFERHVGWECYLADKLPFPFQARCIEMMPESPLILDEEVTVTGLLKEAKFGADASPHPMARAQLGDSLGTIEGNSLEAQGGASHIGLALLVRPRLSVLNFPMAEKFKPGWRAITNALREHDYGQTELLALLSDLYKLSADNRDFLHTRFSLGNDGLLPYKKIIRGALFPDINDNPDLKTARQAVRRYQQAIGDSEGTLPEATCMAFISNAAFFGGGFFARLEVAADAEAVKPSIYPPGRDAVPVFKPADDEC